VLPHNTVLDLREDQSVIAAITEPSEKRFARYRDYSKAVSSSSSFEQFGNSGPNMRLMKSARLIGLPSGPKMYVALY